MGFINVCIHQKKLTSKTRFCTGFELPDDFWLQIDSEWKVDKQQMKQVAWHWPIST